MSVALDTNILVYAESTGDEPRKQSALAITDRLGRAKIIPTQVLGEFYRVLVRKGGLSRDDAKYRVVQWSESSRVVSASVETFQAALGLTVDHQLDIWDAVILATAASAGCEILLTEDLHDGFTWSGVTVVNPFTSPRHPLIELLLADSSR
ncbi:MAG: PIN domain-containing protein [Thermomicrobiales bacterium]|nr:PIN domain-containing protein [Thermomicrobiales bacterium]MCO5222689.1 PIN domain-containing protein [Thermomicrobiales bacterium]